MVQSQLINYPICNTNYWKDTK